MIQGLRDNRWRECDRNGSARNGCCDGRRNDSCGSGKNLRCSRVISDSLNRGEGADNNRCDYGRLGCVESSAIGDGYRVRGHRSEGCCFRRSTDNSAEHNIRFCCRCRNQRSIDVRDCVVVSRPYRLGAGHGNWVGTNFRSSRSTNHLYIISFGLLDGLTKY